MGAPQKETACRVGARQTAGTAENTSPHSHSNTAHAQRDRLLKALQSGQVTTLQARREIDVMHPAARVMELRAQGVLILTNWTSERSECGKLHRIASYALGVRS
jgi:hypothetical protein